MSKTSAVNISVTLPQEAIDTIGRITHIERDLKAIAKSCLDKPGLDNGKSNICAVHRQLSIAAECLQNAASILLKNHHNSIISRISSEQAAAQPISGGAVPAGENMKG